MRDLVAFLFLLAALPMAVFAPFAGYLLWGWAGLVALNYYLYGFMAGLGYVQLFAITTLLALVLGRDPLMRKFEPNRSSVLLLLLVAHGLLVATLAYPGLVRNWELYGNVVKTALFCLLMPMLVVNRLRVHAMVVMIAMAVSFHGALDGLKFIASGGAHNAQSIKTFGDNNHLAVVLLMVLPLLYYVYQYARNRLLRTGFLLAMPLTVLAVVATHSRGALVGLFAIALWLVLKSRKKVAGVAVVLLCAVLVLQLAPQKWNERMGTIQTAEQDKSFMGRVTAWNVSSAIALANPVFGGGFRALQSHEVWNRFKDAPGLLGAMEPPQLERTGVAAHSIWFEVLGDQGFVGLFLFVALIVNAFLTRRAVWRLVRINGPGERWAGDLADMIGASLLAYVVAGSLLSAAYFELPYVLFMLLEVLKQIQLRVVALPAATAPPMAGAGPLAEPVRPPRLGPMAAFSPRRWLR
jgi:probable O-glycosylation ligase (exosortase A-associated)